MPKHCTVVGAGLAGATAARLHVDAGWSVTVFETRPHIGGNCYDEMVGVTFDEVIGSSRILPGAHCTNPFGLHRLQLYGPHIFHTNSEVVWNFVQRFSEWRPYTHRVAGWTGRSYIDLPVTEVSALELSRATGVPLTPDVVRESIFRPYSEKMWGMPLEDIPAEITNRLPTIRPGSQSGYFTDKYQALPVHGFADFFERLLYGSEVLLDQPENAWQGFSTDRVIYTGRLDGLFNNCYGQLPWRGMRFDFQAGIPDGEFLRVGTVNSCTPTQPFIRTSCTYAQDGKGASAIFTTDYSELFRGADSDVHPAYPIPFPRNVDTQKLYAGLLSPNFFALGRLATYKYLNMDATILQVINRLDGEL